MSPEFPESISYELYVIFNQSTIHLLTPSPIKLQVFSEHIVFQSYPEVIKIPYSEIKSIRAVGSMLHNKNKAYISWAGKELTFGVVSLMDRREVDIDLTARVVDLIVSCRDKKDSPAVIKERFAMLEPIKIKKQKRILLIKQLMLIFVTIGLIASMCFIFSEYLLWIMPMWVLILALIWVLFFSPSRMTTSFHMAVVTFCLIIRNRNLAVKRLHRILDKYPNHLEANWILAKSYYNIKDWVNAKTYYQKAAILDPANQEFQRMVGILDKY